MSTKYDETYDIVVSMAKAKMMMNAHKGNIEDANVEDLIQGAKLELDELQEAIGMPEDQVHIIEEVADVLNFAIAAAYNALYNYRGRKNVKD